MDKNNILADVTDALENIREMIKSSVVKYECHTITKEQLKEIFSVLQKIKTILRNIEMQRDSFEKMYVKIMELILSNDEWKISQELETALLPLVDSCIAELRQEESPNNKKTIKIKYIDFYPEFEPQNHWLYQLLIKKYNVVFSETPDYLFFSCFGHRYLQYDCIRIFISNEAVYPNLNLYDYAITYSDFKITDRLLPNRDAFEDLKYRRLADSREAALEILNSKTEFCNFVYSNGMGDPYRKSLFDAINRYKPVVSGGRFLNNTGFLVDDLEDFQRRFKFSIACENSYYRGYTTEKIINAFNAGTIPIYWGNPDISEIINSKAIINCHDFSSLGEIVEEIKHLDEDDEAYLEKLMQPILVKEDMTEEYLAEREEFISNILEQPYAGAFRRNRCLRGQWYNDWFNYVCGYPNEWFSEEKDYFVKKKRPLGKEGPLVSVLIPVYNRQDIIEDTVESVLRQTWQNTEIILVDNCSTDGTYEKLQRRYGEYSNVKLYQNEKNIGPVNNWIECLSKATGKYVKILWSDDLIVDNFIEKCVEVLENDFTVGFVYSSAFVFVDNDISVGRPLHYLDLDTGRYSKEVFYKGMFQDEADLPVSATCAMFRREDVIILDNIPNDIGVNPNKNGAGIDVLIYLQALLKYSNYYYIHDIMAYFRWHAGSFTASNNLVREYNLAKAWFCKNFEDAKKYLPYMKMRILRDEGIQSEEEGIEVLRRYGCM